MVKLWSVASDSVLAANRNPLFDFTMKFGKPCAATPGEPGAVSPSLPSGRRLCGSRNEPRDPGPQQYSQLTAASASNSQDSSQHGPRSSEVQPTA